VGVRREVDERECDPRVFMLRINAACIIDSPMTNESGIKPQKRYRLLLEYTGHDDVDKMKGHFARFSL
jgi:hypothetical protein